MSLQFLYHILISWWIFYLLASGCRFFLKLKGTLDFSYIAIIVFWTYTWTLLNIHQSRDIFASIWWAFLISIVFTFLVLYLSGKLNEIYFSIWSLALYILCYQLALNLKDLTWGTFWLTNMQRDLFFWWNISSLEGFLVFTCVLVVLIILFLFVLKKTFFYKVLKARGEREIVIKALWVNVNRYKLIMIMLTTFLAVLGGNLYAFYYLYIDPPSFWLSMLIPILVIVFVWYKFNDIWLFLVAILTIGGYEYLRFFKLVDPSKIWYFREIIFAIIIMLASFRIFKSTHFWRET